MAFLIKYAKRGNGYEKKSLTVLCCATLLLCSCGQTVTTKNVDSAKTSNSSVENDTLEESHESVAEESIVDVEEKTIYDENNIKVTVMGFEQDSTSVWLNVLAENNSDKDVILQTRNSSVNGYMVDSIFSCDVASGKKANDKISIYNYELDKCGIGKITDIEFILCITDDTFINNSYSDTIHITRNLPEPSPQKYDDSGEVLFDDKLIKIISKDLEIDSFGDASFWFYIENNSEDTIVIQTRNTSINGFMVDGIFSCEVLPGKRAIDDISVYKSQLEDNGITDIETLETSFHITPENFVGTIADSEPITITYQ